MGAEPRQGCRAPDAVPHRRRESARDIDRRYASNSRFARYAHSGREEFLVLEGAFQDETGDFSVGTYVRNPPGTGHAPGSENGCTMFVKLRQFRADDRERVVRRPGEGEHSALRPGVISSLILFESTAGHVTLEEWRPGAEVELVNPEGLELPPRGRVRLRGRTQNQQTNR